MLNTGSTALLAYFTLLQTRQTERKIYANMNLIGLSGPRSPSQTGDSEGESTSRLDSAATLTHFIKSFCMHYAWGQCTILEQVFQHSLWQSFSLSLLKHHMLHFLCFYISLGQMYKSRSHKELQLWLGTVPVNCDQWHFWTTNRPDVLVMMSVYRFIIAAAQIIINLQTLEKIFCI